MDRSFDVQRDQKEILQAALARLAPGGELLFSTNFRRFKLEAEAVTGFSCEEITAQTIPTDFARGRPIHRCWRIRSEPTPKTLKETSS